MAGLRIRRILQLNNTSETKLQEKNKDFQNQTVLGGLKCVHF